MNAKLNGPTKVAGIIVAAGATAVGSSYVTVLTATPSRAEVSGLVGAAVAAVKETQGLDRTTMLEWRAMQQENFEGLRADVQRLAEAQAGTNRLLDVLVQRQFAPPQ